MTTTINYQQQATDLLTKMGVKFTAKYLHYDRHFVGEKTKRHIFLLTLSRGDGENIKSFSVKFGQSIAAGKETPTTYDLLASIQKYDVGSFEDFCSEFGYEDNEQAENIYRALCNEWWSVGNFFTEEEIEQLQEIN